MIAIREIPECPGYDVDTNGRVFSRVKGARRELKQFDRMLLSGKPSGYMTVNIKRNGKRRNQYVHELVLLAFVGPRPGPEYEVCHGPDRTRSNNTLANLRWGTIAENTQDRRDQGGFLRGDAWREARGGCFADLIE